MKSVTQVTYDQIAPAFAQANARMPENVLSAAQKFLDRVPQSGLYLDLGCGPGWDLAWFEQHQLSFIGADLSTGMLTEARKVTACPLFQMDMLSLGFANSVFNGIWCYAALLHLPKTAAPHALQEMRRVLCAQGILDISVQQGEGEGLEVNPYTNNLQRFFARYSMDEMTAMLASNGFSVFETSRAPFNQRVWLHFAARVVK